MRTFPLDCREKSWIWIFGIFLLALPVFGGEVETLPEPPKLQPDIHHVEEVSGSHELTHPYLPPMTTTRDGRIGLMRKRFNAGAADARFHLVVPESLTDEFLLSDPGAEILGPAEDVTASDFDAETDPSAVRASHFAICDPVDSGEQNENPTPCAGNPGRDCYDFYVVSAVQIPASNKIDLWRAAVHVEVTDPKTASAAIASVTVTKPGSGDKGAALTLNAGAPGFHTPMIVGDNRLIMARIGPGSLLDWTDNSSVTRTGRYDTVYAHYGSAEGNGCDIDEWSDWKPIVFASADDDLEDGSGNKLYDFTEYPFRSASGVELNTDPTMAAVPDLGARYIWMDFGAKNLFFATGGRKLIDETPDCLDYRATMTGTNPCRDLYDLSCLPGATCSPYDVAAETQASFYPDIPAEESEPVREQPPPHMVWSFAGLWSHGKMVVLDNYFNNIDFAIEANEDHHRMATLFDGLDYRIGTGRTATVLGGSWDDPRGWPATTVQFGSPEHLLHSVPEMQPRSPFDVVWISSAGARTDEVVFDDYLDRRMLIFSPMNALFDASEDMNNTSVPIAIHPYYDGNESYSTYADMRLQNAATTLLWNPPAYGEVVASSSTTGRIENVALGGVKARGFYLYEGSRIEYDIPDQPSGSDPNDQEWVVSLFLDPNFTDPESIRLRRLLTFEGGAYIDIQGFGRIKVCPAGGGLCPSVKLPKYLDPNNRLWTHLAFHLEKDPVTPANSKLRFFQDGFPFAEMDLPSSMELFGSGGSTAGTLTVGTPSGVTYGVEGWIDEVRVLQGPVGYELLCNHAHGSMRAVPPSYACSSGFSCVSGTELDTIVSRFANYSDPGASIYSTILDGRELIHEALYGSSAATSDESDYYLCQVDYETHLGISVHDPGDDAARPIRRQLQFPEGPLVSGELRPDSTANTFCLACHDDSEKAGLTEAALDLQTSCAEAPMGMDCIVDYDPRRQPSQAPALMLGHVPEDLFGVDKPGSDLEDQRIDQWLHDGPLYRWTFDEGAGSTADNVVMGDPEATSNDGAITGAAHVSSSGHRTHYLEFDAGLDGVSDDVDHVAIDNDIVIDSGQITLSAWFRLGDVDGVSDTPEETCRNFVSGKEPCTIVAKAESGEDWLIRITNVGTPASPTWRIYFIVKLDGTTTEVLTHDPSSFDASAWHHVAGTYDGNEMKLYLDGGSTADESDIIGAGDLATGSNAVLIGARLHPNGTDVINPFYGLIDDVRIYNRALLGWEVDDLHSSTP